MLGNAAVHLSLSFKVRLSSSGIKHCVMELLLAPYYAVDYFPIAAHLKCFISLIHVPY